MTHARPPLLSSNWTLVQYQVWIDRTDERNVSLVSELVMESQNGFFEGKQGQVISEKNYFSQLCDKIKTQDYLLYGKLCTFENIVNRAILK